MSYNRIRLMDELYDEVQAVDLENVLRSPENDIELPDPFEEVLGG